MSALDFWFDYSCPYAYLASTQVEALAARTGAQLAFRPMLLGGVFSANGTPQNLQSTMSEAKKRHGQADLMRWAAFHGVPLQTPPGHPLRTVDALRATLACGIDPAVVAGFYRAYWVEGRDVAKEDTVREVLAAAGHDPVAVQARAASTEVKNELRVRTEQAVALGIFGAPAFVCGDQLFWGQDRIAFVEEAIGAATAPGRPKGTPGSSYGTPGQATTHRSQAAHTGRVLELYWDFSSPFAYLASTQAEALAARTGATLAWRPMLLGAVFKAVGQVDLPLNSFSEAKRRYVFADMQRWAMRYGVPFVFPAQFPVRTVRALRAWLALPEERRAPFLHAAFRAAWGENRDLGDAAVVRSVLDTVAGDGVDAEAILAATESPAVKQQLFEATRRAVDAGVFGAPSWVVDGQVYWGQDRIPLVERALLTPLSTPLPDAPRP